MRLGFVLVLLVGVLGCDGAVRDNDLELVVTHQGGAVVVRGTANDRLRLSELAPGEWALANEGPVSAAPIIEFHAWDQDFLFTSACAEEPLLPGKDCRLRIRRDHPRPGGTPQPAGTSLGW